MKKLSLDQRKVLAEFFTNGAVAWLSAAVIAPFSLGKTLMEAVISGSWGILFTLIFLTISLFFSKGTKS